MRKRRWRGDVGVLNCRARLAAAGRGGTCLH